MINIETNHLRKQNIALREKARELQAKIDATPSIEEKRLLEMKLRAYEVDNKQLRARIATGVPHQKLERLTRAAEAQHEEIQKRPPVLEGSAAGPCSHCGRCVPCAGVRAQYGAAVIDALACSTACARAVLLSPEHVGSLLEVVDQVDGTPFQQTPAGGSTDPAPGPGRGKSGPVLRALPTHFARKSLPPAIREAAQGGLPFAETVPAPASPEGVPGGEEPGPAAGSSGPARP